MRMYVNNKGKVGASFSSGKSSGGCLGLIFILILFIIVVSSCSGKSDADKEKEKAEKSSYRYTQVSPKNIRDNICADDVTTDGAKLYFKQNLEETWLVMDLVTQDVQDNTLTAVYEMQPSVIKTNSNGNDSSKITFHIKISDEVILKKNQKVKVKFIPSEFDRFECDITGDDGVIVY